MFDSLKEKPCGCYRLFRGFRLDFELFKNTQTHPEARDGERDGSMERRGWGRGAL